MGLPTMEWLQWWRYSRIKKTGLRWVVRAVSQIDFQTKYSHLLSQLYSACREGLKKSGWVVTEDSRSRLAGEKPKEISSKLNFSSFLDHYQSYSVAQQLYNKMVRLL